MKIGMIGSKIFDSLEYNLADSLRVLGHEIQLLDVTDASVFPEKITYWASRFIESYERSIALTLARKLSAWRPNVVIIVYRNLHPVLIDELKQKLPDVVIVQVNPDALSNLEKQQILAADFDYYFSKEPYIVHFMRDKAGLNAHYLPEGFNPRIHKRPAIDKAEAEQATNIDVLIFGSLYAYRARMIEQLMRAGLNVAIFGTAGPYLRPYSQSAFRKQYLTGDAKNQLLFGARIVVNTFHYAEVTSVNQKYFEINGIGGFQLSDYKPTLDEYTAVPATAISYQTISEAVDKIRYYLAHSTERHELADRQYQHFQQHHTFDKRVLEMLRIVQQPAPNVAQ
ncbi:glycosyltransferase [Spirosoma sp. BT702]|uniref:Glycosyltransferase n=1 Tax=Spirosoma profusum TaxID=2771354 RepID=A0A927AUS9_9BACT|nr:glycosyltransferase [Spirosoma profusum]MBD2704801.1 glycosyltransferase [Spirosoma profusum]